MHSMEMRKQGTEGQGTARSASKSAKKQPGEQASSSDQSTSEGHGANQGTATAQGTSASERTAGMHGGATQGTAAQSTMGTSANQGTGQNQGTAGQQGGEEDLLQHAKHAGGEIVSQVQQRAGSQLNRQKETAASQLSQVANAVRRIRENLSGEDIGPIARYAADYGDRAADGLERFSNYIRQQDPKQLLDDVQNFGRRRPALLLGGAFLLGFAGARLIKSATTGYQQQQSFGTDRQSSNYPGTKVPAVRPSTGPNVL
jgi:hypothetical protein